MEALLRAGADPDSLSVASRMLEDATPEEGWQKANVGATPLEAAASHGHREVVERLLRAGAEPRFALHAAAYSGSVELIDFFLRRGADPRRKGPFGNGPIRHAVMKGHLAAIQRLLEAGARSGEQALREAASNGLDDALHAMAEHGFRFDGPPTYWGPTRIPGTNLNPVSSRQPRRSWVRTPVTPPLTVGSGRTNAWRTLKGRI